MLLLSALLTSDRRHIYYQIIAKIVVTNALQFHTRVTSLALHEAENEASRKCHDQDGPV